MINQIAKRYRWTALFILIFPLFSSCTTSSHDSYFRSVGEFNRTIASHEVARVDLNPDGTVRSIVFSGQPKFLSPVPEANPILEGMKIVLPIASRLIDPSGIVLPMLKAGGDIVYNMDSNNSTDIETSVIDESTIPTTTSISNDSHDDNSSIISSPEVTP